MNDESSFRCCYGIMTRDHGAFNYLYRWSVRHMLTEFLMVAILVYLQLTDHYAGVWSMCAAIISLVGASIPSFCFSNAPGWRVNFGLQVIVIIIRMAVVAYIIWSFTREFQDSELASNRICQLATIVLSTLSLSPLFHMSLKSSWLINMRPMDVRGGTAAQGGNRVHAGQESLLNQRDGGGQFSSQSSNRPYNIKKGEKSGNGKKGDADVNINNTSSNMMMSDSYYHQDRDREKYMRDLDINYIAEGNEDEPDDDGSSDIPSPMSSATVTPFHKKANFSNKENGQFSFENAMHSSKSKRGGGETPTGHGHGHGGSNSIKSGISDTGSAKKQFYNTGGSRFDDDDDNMSINSRGSRKQQPPNSAGQSSSGWASARNKTEPYVFSPSSTGPGPVPRDGYGYAPRAPGEKGPPLSAAPDEYSQSRFSPKGSGRKGNVNLLSI